MMLLLILTFDEHFVSLEGPRNVDNVIRSDLLLESGVRVVVHLDHVLKKRW